MNSVDILIQGLCLWLTGSPGRLTAVIPDFHSAEPAHNAVLIVPKEHLREGACPQFFSEDDDDCTFVLNGSGAAGGVRIDVAGTIEETETPLPSDLQPIPRIEHDGPLRMRREYEPDDGSRLAARLLVTRGTITTEEEDCLSDESCPRRVRWTLTAPRGGELDMVLSNLLGGRQVVVPLARGAQVTVRNRARTPKQTTPIAHWCLYYTMFEEAGCRGLPKLPSAPARRPSGTATAHAHADKPDPRNIETLACSNSQYP